MFHHNRRETVDDEGQESDEQSETDDGSEDDDADELEVQSGEEVDELEQTTRNTCMQQPLATKSMQLYFRNYVKYLNRLLS